jgi:hypothetical protein
MIFLAVERVNIPREVVYIELQIFPQQMDQLLRALLSIISFRILARVGVRGLGEPVILIRVQLHLIEDLP